MWEEPRPERLRRDKAARNRDAFQSLIAYAVILGVAVMLVKVGAIDLGGKRATAPAIPAPEVTPRLPTTAPAGPPPHGSADSRAMPDPVTLGPATSSRTPTNTALGDPNVMRTMTETCRYWVQQNTRGQYSGNQEVACRDMATYARNHGFPVPTISGRAPSVPSPSSESFTQRRPDIYVDECDRYSYGSIAYRQCRANEKRRLSNECQQLKERLVHATGSGREQLRALVSAMCSASDRYRIVQ